MNIDNLCKLLLEALAEAGFNEPYFPEIFRLNGLLLAFNTTLAGTLVHIHHRSRHLQVI